jgi:uracil-DNA glycosylase family 4
MTLLAEYPSVPSHDCPLCLRLAAFRDEQRQAHPDWFNAPVPSFGDSDAWLAIVGLAPGMQGANRTGRPFTGDQSGPLIYETLLKCGLASGEYLGRPDDGMTLHGTIIVNAVRCLPPQNKPTPEEMRTCRSFLEQDLAGLSKLKIVVALGQIAHQSAVKALGGRLPKAPFGHGNVHRMPSGLIVIDSYHCSRYNQNTGVLTAEMFEAVFAKALELRRAS